MKIFLASLFILTSSCSLFNAGKREIHITSSPPAAEVSYLAKEGALTSLGKTPVKLSDEQINNMFEGKQFLLLQVKKSGHAVENVVIDLRSSGKIDYFSLLKPIDVWNNKELEISSTAANQLAQKIVAINQQVLKKNNEGALARTEALIQQFPKASSFYDMKGSILLLMGKKSEAISSYEQSLSLSPDNTETQRLLSQLKGR